MSRYILALDSGTTSVRSVLVNPKGEVVKMASRAITLEYPKPGWVLQDPQHIVDAQIESIEEVLTEIDLASIDSIGITNQRETLIVWNKETGSPIYPAINWQSRQTKHICEQWKVHEALIQSKTGLRVDPYFSASKLRFILDEVKDINPQEVYVGTVDTWLLYKLSNHQIYATDHTNASRTMLFNIHDLCWDEELIRLFGFEGIQFPKVLPSSANYGSIHIIERPISVTGVAGDQQASLFGHGCFDQGEVKCTYGTGAFVLMHTGTQPISNTSGLITTLACSLNHQAHYATEGSVFIAGALMKWLVDKLHLAPSVALTSQLALESVADEELVLIPAFTGLGAPYWQPKARGMILGLKASTTPEQLLKAGLEAIGFQIYEIMMAMNQDIKLLSVDGKASENEYLMQFQANVLNTQIVKWKSSEQTALGVAFLAGLHTGFFTSMTQLRNLLQVNKIIKPKMDEAIRHRQIRKWKKAIRIAILASDLDE